MKTLVFEHTAPFQALPELVADAEGLFAREGLKIEWANTNVGVDRNARTDVYDPARPRSLPQPRPAARAGQGRHVQRLRMGQLLPRAGHQRQSRQLGRRAIVDLCRHRRAAGLRRSTRRSSSPAARSACRSISARTISRCTCWKASCRATDHGLQRAERLALPLRSVDEGRDRGHHADRALCHARREEGLPRHLLGFLSTAPRSAPTRSMPRPCRL